MNCEEANKVDLVECLYSLGFTPTKINEDDYWYLLPFRNEKQASFKVSRSRNAWYDYNRMKSGSVIDFAIQYFNCEVQEALQKLDTYFSFHQQNTLNKQEERSLFHLRESGLPDLENSAEVAVQIIATKQHITNPSLCRYLSERRIDQIIADKYCFEVQFRVKNQAENFTAIGFKNNAGGYELRSEFLTLNSSPKFVTFINNNSPKNVAQEWNVGHRKEGANQLKKNDKNNLKNDENNIQNACFNSTVKQHQSIVVFEDCCDFLTWQTINRNQPCKLTNFLVLNSLIFFERSLLLMEKHSQIHLYLKNNEAAKKCVELAQRRSSEYKDESKIYEKYKDLNDWTVHFGKHPLDESKKMRFP